MLSLIPTLGVTAATILSIVAARRRSYPAGGPPHRWPSNAVTHAREVGLGILLRTHDKLYYIANLNIEPGRTNFSSAVALLAQVL